MHRISADDNVSKILGLLCYDTRTRKIASDINSQLTRAIELLQLIHRESLTMRYIPLY